MDIINLPESVPNAKLGKSSTVTDKPLVSQSFMDLNISNDAKRKISQILERVVSGNSVVFSAPYVKDRTAESILSGLDDIFNKHASLCNEQLMDLEMSNRSKYGPMSLAKPWKDRRESLYSSFYGITSKRNFAPFLLSEPKRLRPITSEIAVGNLKNDSNSGLPDVTKKKNVKDSFKGYTLDDFYTAISGNYQNFACILFTRTQESLKTRNVWGFAVLVTLYEMLFYRPVLDIQRKQDWRAALRTPDDVNLGVTKLIDYSISKGLSILSIDFSGYDNSVKHTLITNAFKTISNSFQAKYGKYIDLICDFFINVGIITPDGILHGPHGVPSGSTFTNEVDSIVQFGIARECDFIDNVQLSQIQGDDGLYCCLNANRVIEHFLSYGLNVNKDKSYIALNWAVYLQQLFHEDYRDEKGIICGIYPLYRALNRILYLESFDNFSEWNISGTDYFSIRTISIMEQCKHHPLFREFVTYVWSLDKYKLEVSDQGLANYVRKLAIQEGKDISFRNWTYGSNISGLKSFESVKIINSLNNM